MFSTNLSCSLSRVIFWTIAVRDDIYNAESVRVPLPSRDRDTRGRDAGCRSGP